MRRLFLLGKKADLNQKEINVRIGFMRKFYKTYFSETLTGSYYTHIINFTLMRNFVKHMYIYLYLGNFCTYNILRIQIKLIFIPERTDSSKCPSSRRSVVPSA